MAVIPPKEVQEKVQQIKISIRDQFGMKYALKSPPHITLKMPFNYNEGKELVLAEKLSGFLKDRESFKVKIDGLGTFGNRVIFLKIEKSPDLIQLQSELKDFCKKELNLIDELSDRNFHPHLTVAFKDLKPKNFEEILALVKEQSFKAEFAVEGLFILKRMEQRWNLHKELFFEPKNELGN